MNGKRFDFYIETKADLIDTINACGFVPLFANSVPGFSVEEHVSPRVWFNGNDDGVWEWKGPVIRESGCAYGKFFEHKAVFISREWFPDFANYRRDGYDFDARFDDELASYEDKYLFELLDANAPILSKRLKALGYYRKGGRKGFDTGITRLQEQCYVLISDFVYERDRYGRPYGWGVAEYATPEVFMGKDFTDKVYSNTPLESYQRILNHMKELLPDVDETTIRRIIK